MKRTLVLAAFVAALFACRALVGIEELDGPEPQRPPGNNAPDGGDGGGGSSSGNPGGPEDDIAECAARGDCFPCCKEKFDAFRDTFERGEGAACMCEKSTCRAACSTGICAPVPVEGKPLEPCAQCKDPFLAMPDNPCKSECKGDPRCEDGLRCMQACPKKP